jgi:hypothetical protein
MVLHLFLGVLGLPIELAVFSSASTSLLEKVVMSPYNQHHEREADEVRMTLHDPSCHHRVILNRAATHMNAVMIS